MKNLSLLHYDLANLLTLALEDSRQSRGQVFFWGYRYDMEARFSARIAPVEVNSDNEARVPVTIFGPKSNRVCGFIISNNWDPQVFFNNFLESFVVQVYQEIKWAPILAPESRE